MTKLRILEDSDKQWTQALWSIWCSWSVDHAESCPLWMDLLGMNWDDDGWCNLMFFTWAPIGFSGTLGPSSMWLSSFFLQISLGQTALGPWAVCPKEAIRSPPNLRSQSDHPSLTASSHDLGRWAFGCRRKACELHQVWGPRDLGGVFFLFFFLDHPGGFKVIVYKYIIGLRLVFFHVIACYYQELYGYDYIQCFYQNYTH